MKNVRNLKRNEYFFEQFYWETKMPFSIELTWNYLTEEFYTVLFESWGVLFMSEGVINRVVRKLDSLKKFWDSLKQS